MRFLATGILLWYQTTQKRGLYLPKFAFFMKVSCFVITALLCGVQALMAGDTNAQGIEDVPITLELKNAPLKLVFKRIEQLSSFRFAYKDRDLKHCETVSLPHGTRSVRATLDLILHNTSLYFKQVGNNVIVLPRKNNPEPDGRPNAYNEIETMVYDGIIKGKVTNAKGEPLAGASVTLTGTNLGTSANNRGEFVIPGIKQGTYRLQVTVIGYDDYVQEITVADGQTVEVTAQLILNEASNPLEDVVIVGYGKQKKATLTGSVTQITAAEIRQSASVNVSNALAGRMPGVITNNRSGEPGADGSNIIIRGAGTTGNTAPLFVIDGVANRTGFERLNPNDIESISILKDASAAIYGAQAANGVILITTKRGKTGKPSISYDGSFGLSQPTRVPDLVNSYEYALFRNEKDKRQNVAQPTFSEAQIQKYKDGSDPLNYPSTDWYDMVLKPWTPQTQHSITISGGADRVKYYLSGGYTYQDAFYRKSATNYRQYNARLNVDAQIAKNLKISADLAGISENRHYPPTGSDGIFLYILGTYPGLAPFYPNGLPVAGVEGPNPVQMAQGWNGYNKRSNNRVQTLVSFELKLPFITNGLSLTGFAAHDFSFYNDKTFNKPFDLYRYDSTNKVYNNVKSSLLGQPSIGESYGSNLLKTYNLKLNYERRFNDHSVNTFIAVEQSDYYNEGINASRQVLVSSLVDQLFAFNTDVTRQGNGGNADQNARRNFFGRLNYSYKEKYLAEFVLRRDGSFNFPPGKQYGNFPGISVGWRISEETFFKRTAPFVNQLKLRASYSKLGNDRVAQYQFLARYTVADGHNRYYLGNGDNPGYAPGLMPGVAPNPNITWETERMTNLALEGAVLNNKLDFSVEYYTARREHILAPRNASVPATAGLRLPDENIGIVDRNGIEITLGHRNTVGKDFRYSITGNFTKTRNKIVFVDEPANVLDWQKRQGFQYGQGANGGSWLLYKTDGIFNTQEEVNETAAKLPGTKPGDIKYLDIDKDGAITARDQVRLYESPVPLIIYGTTMSVEYKGISLNLLWQGQAKVSQVIVPQGNNAEFIPPKWVFNNRWTPDNPDAALPGAFDRTYNINNRDSDFWLKDMSFLKLKSAELAYTFQPTFIKRLGLNYLRTYINGFNLFSIDKVKYYDPETVARSGAYYPQTRIFTMGVNLNF
jgi:TonB-linked SusC/RagA family outer membrane protein